MKIGFYGSSLCSSFDNEHSKRFGYETYISKLQKHYDADICHLGEAGSGYWDLIILQFKELLENPPDVAIFMWSGQEHLFHRDYRLLHEGSSLEGSRVHSKRPDLWPAVNLYYKHLHDREKETLEYFSALMYFDQVMLPKINSKTKIIHFWEYGLLDSRDPDLSSSNYIKEVTYPYTWSKGVELRCPLVAVSAAGQWPRRPNMKKVINNDPRCNHLDGDEKNDLMFNWIVDAIENYQQGVIDKVSETVKFYELLTFSNQ